MICASILCCSSRRCAGGMTEQSPSVPEMVQKDGQLIRRREWWTCHDFTSFTKSHIISATNYLQVTFLAIYPASGRYINPSWFKLLTYPAKTCSAAPCCSLLQLHCTSLIVYCSMISCEENPVRPLHFVLITA